MTTNESEQKKEIRQKEIEERAHERNGVWRYAGDEASFNPYLHRVEYFDEEDDDGQVSQQVAAQGKTYDEEVAAELKGTSSASATPTDTEEEGSPTSPADFDA